MNTYPMTRDEQVGGILKRENVQGRWTIFHMHQSINDSHVERCIVWINPIEEERMCISLFIFHLHSMDSCRVCLNVYLFDLSISLNSHLSILTNRSHLCHSHNHQVCYYWTRLTIKEKKNLNIITWLDL
jgi:hypothetical protein